MKAFVVDLSVCNGCYCCQIACKDEHVANDWTHTPSRSRTPASSGSRFMSPSGAQYRRSKCPTPPTCACTAMMPSAWQGAKRGRFTGGKTAWSSSIRPNAPAASSARILPNGMIYFNENLNLSQKCTGCAHLLDDGVGYPPLRGLLPTKAIKFGEERESPHLSLRPNSQRGQLQRRVYYLNIPKKFVAGTVYDPEEKEVLIGATCTLKTRRARRPSRSRPTSSATSGSTACPTSTACIR